MSDQSAPPEIVIVRRKAGDDEEGHHGGAWKIAYADFMTAMMAFFLVMWLVNASDKKVLTQVASYFNPIKMSDRVTAAKGIDEMIEGGQKKGEGKAEYTTGAKEKSTSDGAEGASKSSPKNAEAQAEKAKKQMPGGMTDLSEQELFNDPYGILEKLAASATGGKKTDTPAEREPEQDKETGTAFRDPFDPDFNRVALGEEQRIDKADQQGASGQDDKAEPEATNKDATFASRTEAKLDPKPSEKADAEVAALQAKLERELKGIQAGERPSVSVTATPEGTLISLTDEFDFEMFSVASAKPNPQLVIAMKKIAGVLKNTDRRIVVRGHTDSRKFKSGVSDNWLLSSKRALISRYILISGGIPEKRFSKIEGYADTALRLPQNPLAAQNRRIEVLLYKAGSP